MAAAKPTMKITTFLVLVIATAISVGADESVNLSEGGFGTGGYDPAAYFLQDQALPGKPEISAEHEGTTYLFSSDANRQRFREDPERFLPAYGGYCAWAVGQGYIADIDPEAWTVHEDRLYLNFNKSIRRRFDRNLEENIRSAEANWPGLKP